MKNLNKILLLVLALCLAFAAVGCTPAAEEAAPEVNVPVQDIADELLAMDDQFPSMMDFGEETVTELCGLDYSMLEDYSINDAMMNVHARALYIAKVKDMADMDAVKEAFQKRLDLLQQSFETYLPDQYELAKAGQIVNNGRYVMLVVSTDSQAVVDRFNEILSEAAAA
ncbi:MAG: DUF4358 domain-containing protein [Candidatus Spyradocola sp.]|jgi:hypothetical protein